MPSFWRHRTETPQGVGAGVGGPSHSDSNKDRPCRSHTAPARGGCAWGRPQSTPSVGTVLPQERGLRRGSCRPGSHSGGAACRGQGTHVATEPQPPAPRAFTTLCYSADGESILAGGMSKFVCIYHVKEQVLRKRFAISCNLSLDAMEVRVRHGLAPWASRDPRHGSVSRHELLGVSGGSFLGIF